MIKSLALLVALIFAAPALAQIAPPPQTAPGRTYQVAPNLFVAVQEDRNTTVLVGPESLVIVESNFRERAPALKDLIATISPKPVRLVINSHWHADHVGGNALFVSAGAITLAQEK